MKKVAVALALMASLAGPVWAQATGEGRYRMVAVGPDVAWIVDTQTGEVRRCISVSQPDLGTWLECTPWTPR